MTDTDTIRALARRSADHPADADAWTRLVRARQRAGLPASARDPSPAWAWEIAQDELELPEGATDGLVAVVEIRGRRQLEGFASSAGVEIVVAIAWPDGPHRGGHTASIETVEAGPEWVGEHFEALVREVTRSAVTHAGLARQAALEARERRARRAGLVVELRGMFDPATAGRRLVEAMNERASDEILGIVGSDHGATWTGEVDPRQGLLLREPPSTLTVAPGRPQRFIDHLLSSDDPFPVIEDERLPEGIAVIGDQILDLRRPPVDDRAVSGGTDVDD